MYPQSPMTTLAPASLGPDRLVLLGTKGGPSLRTGLTRLPTSHALICGGELTVIDAGYGVSARLVSQDLPLDAIRRVFITHHHSDHNLELGPLVYNSWVNGLARPIDVYAPPPGADMLRHLLAAYAFDIDIRVADEGLADLRTLVRMHEYGEGAVVSDAGMTVTALRNVHPPITESYALKVVAGGKTIVFSGDTAYLPALADFARGADILVHEVMHGPGMAALVARNPRAKTLMAHLQASHTLAADVGRIATAAGVKRLVLSHLVPGDDPSMTDDIWRSEVAKTFAGDIVVGRDQLVIPLSC